MTRQELEQDVALLNSMQPLAMGPLPVVLTTRRLTTRKVLYSLRVAGGAPASVEVEGIGRMREVVLSLVHFTARLQAAGALKRVQGN